MSGGIARGRLMEVRFVIFQGMFGWFDLLGWGAIHHAALALGIRDWHWMGNRSLVDLQ